MAETLLITKEDIKSFYPIGKNLDNGRVDPHILRAQQSDLKPFLGDALYRDFVTDVAVAKYVTLLDGGEYTNDGHTIFFGGVKPLLASWAYARIQKANPVHVTRGGNVRKETEQSVNLSSAETDAEKTLAESEALRLQSEVYTYLDSNRDTYTLFDVYVTGQNAPKRMSLNITKV